MEKHSPLQRTALKLKAMNAYTILVELSLIKVIIVAGVVLKRLTNNIIFKQRRLPFWTDPCETLALLRACNYDVDECISNTLNADYQHSTGFNNSTQLLQEKDRRIQLLECQLKESVSS